MSGEALVVGQRFAPTDQEILTHYLKKILMGLHSEVDSPIGLIDICDYDPWELPSKSKNDSKIRVWWFFSKPDYKNSNSKRFNRRTRSGHWKITGHDLEIKGQGSEDVIGRKKFLVFYGGSTSSKSKCKSKGSDWVMHEYYSELHHPGQSTYVVCRLECKSEAEMFASEMIADPEENNCGATTENLSTNFGPGDSSNECHIVHDPHSINTYNEGVNEQRADVVCSMEFQPNEEVQNAGMPDYDKGEPSREITQDAEDPLACVRHGRTEVNLGCFQRQLFSPPWAPGGEIYRVEFEVQSGDTYKFAYC